MNRITFYLLDVLVTKLIIIIFTGFLATSTQAEIDFTTVKVFASLIQKNGKNK